MGLLIGLIVNSLLLAIPLGGSLGALLAIRPFNDQIIPPAAAPQNNILTTAQCGNFSSFAQNKNGLNYTINSNEGRPEKGSVLCMNMTTFQNNTYPSNSTAPPFSITWAYPFEIVNATARANETQAFMHAFPQAQPHGDLPVALKDLGRLDLDVSWTMGPGNSNPVTTSLLPLGASQVNATVALNMYIDGDSDKAGEPGDAAFEVIVMFASFGLQHPVGFGTGDGTVIMTTGMDGVDFDLFAGQIGNKTKQNVFTWVATQPAGDFTADIAPFFLNIMNIPPKTAKKFGVSLPSFTDKLGYIGFGTQAYNSLGNVTFSVPKLSIDVVEYGT